MVFKQYRIKCIYPLVIQQVWGPRDCQVTSGIREYQKYLNQTVLLELRNETSLLRRLALVIIVILVIIANVIA